MLIVNKFEQHVGARLLDFFHSATPWQRWLWCPGLVLTLKEILEASEAVHVGVLTEAALRYLCGSAIVLSGPDPGAGTAEQKKRLQQSLKNNLAYRGFDYKIVKQLAGDIEENYLRRWVPALNSPERCPGPERTARAIASHLLDSGLSSDFLHRWWTFKLRYEKEVRSLAELVTDAHELVRRPVKEHMVLVAFEAAPGTKSVVPQWLSASAVSEWLRANGFDVTGIRQSGGIWIRITAKDAWSLWKARLKLWRDWPHVSHLAQLVV